MRVRAYGKINLTLDVLGRRRDGYHLLDTVMQTVSIWDELEIQQSHEPGIHLQCNRESLPLDSKNTVYRAVKLFMEDQGLLNEGVSVFIRKYIPSRSGMGGGSADAAAVLRGLNEMFRTNLSAEKLMEIGERIGADVPFCVVGGAARCTGTGAEVSPAPAMPKCWLVVCKPPVGMSTPRAYALLDQYPLSSTPATPRMMDALAAGNLREIGRNVSNRFDETLQLAQVQTIKRILMESGALGAMMTGSGSSVYGIFENEQTARSAMERLDGQGRVFLAQPCTGV